MVFVKNSDEGVFSPSHTAKSIIRWRSYPSSVGYAATFPQVGKAFAIYRKFSLYIHVSGFSTRKNRP